MRSLYWMLNSPLWQKDLFDGTSENLVTSYSFVTFEAFTFDFLGCSVSYCIIFLFDPEDLSCSPFIHTFLLSPTLVLKNYCQFLLQNWPLASLFGFGFLSSQWSQSAHTWAGILSAPCGPSTWLVLSSQLSKSGYPRILVCSFPVLDT